MAFEDFEKCLPILENRLLNNLVLRSVGLIAPLSLSGASAPTVERECEEEGGEGGCDPTNVLFQDDQGNDLVRGQRRAVQVWEDEGHVCSASWH